ncbi:MAG TPA: cysteine methyltransferase [Rikenellaceae bacterium]|nr:cysteine methyltransferase [Rikenellaceae bacterium]HBH21346.1 cysteine methyltransferase [Rikenellaceae bacterium]
MQANEIALRHRTESGIEGSIQYYNSPCGELILASVDGKLCLCDWNEMPCSERNKVRLGKSLKAVFREESSDVLREASAQLDEYFALSRREFDIPLLTVGTDFQKRVWDALLQIPYGRTRTYMEIARMVGNPRGVRAVAQAIGANGLSIFIPCHRVIGSNKSLTGFAGGLEAKRKLLQIEGQMCGHHPLL